MLQLGMPEPLLLSHPASSPAADVVTGVAHGYDSLVKGAPFTEQVHVLANPYHNIARQLQ